MPDGFTDIAGPERHDRDAATDPSEIAFRLHGRSERVFLGKLFGNWQHIIFSPPDARTVEGPHVIRRSLGIGQRCIQSAARNGDTVEMHVMVSGVLIVS